jgi:hypothetical protein
MSILRPLTGFMSFDFESPVRLYGAIRRLFISIAVSVTLALS